MRGWSWGWWQCPLTVIGDDSPGTGLGSYVHWYRRSCHLDISSKDVLVVISVEFAVRGVRIVDLLLVQDLGVAIVPEPPFPADLLSWNCPST